MFLPEDIKIKTQDGKLIICEIHIEKTSDEEKGGLGKHRRRVTFIGLFHYQVPLTLRR